MEEIAPDIQALVRERRKIEAIRELRLRTGLGLKEAKERIEALERQLGIERPSTSTKSLLFWVVLIVTAVLFYWIATTSSSR
jgi:hypothetical protein